MAKPSVEKAFALIRKWDLVKNVTPKLVIK
jgi:hypothetical protein